mmetsp:Transcript_25921/g.62522  ORF Transcript_25921/g.62522 Transcript_25921/m.62522 type:complete len:340 (+) Transcript_25921:281-1300(+)
MRLLVRLLVAMALLGGLIQFASFEYHQGMEEGLKLAALKERQDAVINATAKALSLEKAHAHAPEPVEGDDPDEEEPPPASPSLAEVDGHGAGSQPGNHSSPSLSARGRSSNETSGVAKRARGNGSSEGERKRQGGKDRKDPRPPCSLLTGVENASACVTRKGRTKAELDELKRLFDATRCKHPPTREIIMGVPLETLERIVKAKKTVITYGTQDWVKSKKRACKAATSKGAADTCLAMDESFMDGPFKAKKPRDTGKEKGGGPVAVEALHHQQDPRDHERGRLRGLPRRGGVPHRPGAPTHGADGVWVPRPPPRRRPHVWGGVLAGQVLQARHLHKAEL